MKIRRGFVSNSSSSSFTCDVCGTSESGWDANPSGWGWIECVQEHVLCPECMLEDKTGEPEQGDDESSEDFDARYNQWAEETEDGYIRPAACCPICQFIEPAQTDAVRYLQKKYSVPKDEVFAEVKKVNKRRRKLYDHEYITYVCQKHNVDLAALLPKLKEEFGTYDKFHEYLRS